MREAEYSYNHFARGPSDLYLQHQRWGEGWGLIDHAKPSPYIMDLQYTPGWETHVIQGPDGFPFAAEATGNPNGKAIILELGIPSGRLGDKLHHSNHPPDTFVIAYDRCGAGPFGRPVLGRSPSDEVRYVKTISEYFNLGPFGIVGRSGGAAFASEIAAGIDKVDSLALIVPIGPYRLMGERWFEGMGELNTRVFRAAFEPNFSKEYLRDPEAFKERYGVFANPFDYTSVEEMLEELRSRTIEGYESLSYTDNDEDMALGITKRGLRAHIDALGKMSLGRLSDIVAQKYWGECLFTIRERGIPVFIWAPADHDQFAPRGHTECIAQCIGPGATCTLGVNSDSSRWRYGYCVRDGLVRKKVITKSSRNNSGALLC